MQTRDEKLEAAVESLRNTMRVLRGPDGCPWDREQSMDDIITYLIEESYELLQAERSGDWDEVAGELGDVFLMVVFIHELLIEQRPVPFSEIVERVHRKIVSRHPHVFGQTKASNTEESIAEWERIKESERKQTGEPRLLDDVPDHLPPLRKATSIQRKVASVGFDWPDARGVIDKLHEEIGELEVELEEGDRERVTGEIGDLLFTVVNLARRLGIPPESALETSSSKFVRRFNRLEQEIRDSGGELDKTPLDELERLWQASKRSE
jgi:MazG family protein